MPQRQDESYGEIQYFVSRLMKNVPGLVHAFPCRVGPPEDSLDKLKSRLKSAFGMKALLTVKQVHGNKVVACDGDVENFRGLGKKNADALITKTPGLAVGVKTADCVPVLLADTRHRAVAAVHAGWRGLAKGVVGAAVKAMWENYSSNPRKIIAAIGPHISTCCYEVGPEVALIFEERFGSEVLEPGRRDTAFLDLGACVTLALLEAGLKEENIDEFQLCTSCQSEFFHSHRRDRRSTGRQLSFIFFQ